jgi:hypothetical protein
MIAIKWPCVKMMYDMTYGNIRVCIQQSRSNHVKLTVFVGLIATARRANAFYNVAQKRPLQ